MATWGNNSLRIWDVETGAALFSLDLPQHKYRDFAFVGPDNALIAKTDAGFERVLWQNSRLIADACRRFARDISDDEWQRFFHDEARRDICSSTEGPVASAELR